jgi:hypothetical protein
MNDLAAITDICQRVLGAGVAVVAHQSADKAWQIVVTGAKPADPLTRSQQEMDMIMSLQHRLAGAAVRVIIESGVIR